MITIFFLMLIHIVASKSMENVEIKDASSRDQKQSRLDVEASSCSDALLLEKTKRLIDMEKTTPKTEDVMAAVGEFGDWLRSGECRCDSYLPSLMEMVNGHEYPVSCELLSLIDDVRKEYKESLPSRENELPSLDFDLAKLIEMEERSQRWNTKDEAAERDNLDTKMWRLHSNIYHRVKREAIYKEFCLTYEYRNGGKPVEECLNGSPNNLPHIPFQPKDYEMCASREYRKRKVVIPSRLESSRGEKMENGTINLSEMFDLNNWKANANSTSIHGRTPFRIPDVEWLIKHGWILEEEKDKGPFFVRGLTILPPYLINRATSDIRVIAWESPVGGKVYTRKKRSWGEYFAQFIYKTRKSKYMEQNGITISEMNLYTTPGCDEPEDLPKPSTLARSTDDFSPSVFSEWDIFTTMHPAHLPFVYPAGTFYLQAELDICFGEPGPPTKFADLYGIDPMEYEFHDALDRDSARKYTWLLANPKTCGCPLDANARRDPITGECVACPAGTESSGNGYTCMSCPPGAEKASPLIACLACEPGYFKAEAGNSECRVCENYSEPSEWGQYGKWQWGRWGSIGC